MNLRAGLAFWVAASFAVAGCGPSGSPLARSGVPVGPGAKAEPAPSVNQPNAPVDLADESGKTDPREADAASNPGSPVPLVNAAQLPALLESQPTPELNQQFARLKSDFAGFLRQTLERLALRKDRSALELRARRDAGLPLTEAQDKCVSAYDQFYSRDEIRFRVAFGYTEFDGEDDVLDRVNQAVLIDFLLQPCPAQGLAACGFVLDEKTLELKKTVEGPGGKQRVIRVATQAASYSVSDELNRGAGRSGQLESSAAARDFFLDGFSRSDVLIYAGHSRDGGGPSFVPPRRIMDRRGFSCPKDDDSGVLENACQKRSLEVDYPWYHRHRIGEQDMLAALREAPAQSRPKFLVLSSCYSNLHFGAELQEAAPGMGLLLSRSLVGFGALDGVVVSVIDGLLQETCRRDLLRPMLIPGFKDSEGHRLDGNMKLTGFF